MLGNLIDFVLFIAKWMVYVAVLAAFVALTMHTSALTLNIVQLAAAALGCLTLALVMMVIDDSLNPAEKRRRN